MDTNLIDNINIYWRRVFHKIKRHSIPNLEKLSLTKVDANILLVLFREKEKTKCELARYFSFKPNALTRSLDRMVALNYVERIIDQNDKRYVKLLLTQKGRSIANQYMKSMRKIWKQSFKNFTENDIKKLEKFLIKMQINLESFE